ncbi:MAG: NAD(P)-dependent oxidoreductase [Gammaproteobacteria bacterium]|nr:NAD(P)-dependent oxidoreductase [Gammaproteobacteria bacterium]
MLRLAGIGALGNMLSHSAMHLLGENSPARFLRIYDRNPVDITKAHRREAWQVHGAKLVSSYEELIQGGDLEGIIICGGKNGDDISIFTQVINQINQHYPDDNKPFILHFSTVSVEFVESANKACYHHKIEYANYPLTGGVKGAETATMLVLASGAKSLYERLEPLLRKIGKPNYYGEEVSMGAKVKLIGHLMVFNGLMGITSAAALQNKSLKLSLQTEEEFFNFLNQGAGGTRQWDITLKQAIVEGVWDKGFLLVHAAIDAIYTADLLIKYHMPAISIYPILQISTAFSFLVDQYGPQIATQSLLKAMVASPGALDEFTRRFQDIDIQAFLENSIKALPGSLQEKVKLRITEQDFVLS